MALASLSGCGGDGGDASVSFHRDVAPIVHSSCSGCHRPGEAAPFSLLTYEDVQKRARQIEEVVTSGYMPPWLPLEGYGGPFLGERRLTLEEVRTVQAWVEAGAPEGRAGDGPEPPPAGGGWQLGEPDLVIRLQEPYTLAAEGRDVYRNFVIPIPVDRSRHVRAVELRPDNRFVLHHAVMRVDRSGSARALDERHPGPGFEGMGMGQSEVPDGHFLGWAPGKVAFEGYPDMAWRLEPGMELVLQMHLRPTGRPETIQPSIGFFFADEPPTRHPIAITLADIQIDIPAGEAAYTVEDRFELPVAARVLAVYPHAHYLGKELSGFAELPGGGTRWLFKIDPWDFNWQDEYRFSEPPLLPASSTLVMRTTFDNSADNPLNPSDPPRRVVYGEASTDEMAELLVQLLPEDPAERPALIQAFMRKNEWRAIAYFQALLEADPADLRAHQSLGMAYLRLFEFARAVPHFRAIAEARPTDVLALHNLGTALVWTGEPALVDEALEVFRGAAGLRPDVRAKIHVGLALLRRGRAGDAITELEGALAMQPGHPRALTFLGAAYLEKGRLNEAEQSLLQALRANPNDFRAYGYLGDLLLLEGEDQRAEEAYDRARALVPDFERATGRPGRKLEGLPESGDIAPEEDGG